MCVCVVDRRGRREGRVAGGGRVWGGGRKKEGRGKGENRSRISRGGMVKGREGGQEGDTGRGRKR